MKQFWLIAAAAIATSVSLAVPATAAPLFFSYTNLSAPQDDFTFDLDSDPTPFEYASDGFGVFTDDPTGSAAVLTNPALPYLAAFGTSTALFQLGTGQTIFTGPELFTGDTSAPHFSPGTFALNDVAVPAYGGTLTISSLAAAVPEPGTWALMLVGFGAMGMVLRRRKPGATIAHAS